MDFQERDLVFPQEKKVIKLGLVKEDNSDIRKSAIPPTGKYFFIEFLLPTRVFPPLIFLDLKPTTATALWFLSHLSSTYLIFFLLASLFHHHNFNKRQAERERKREAEKAAEVLE